MAIPRSLLRYLICLDLSGPLRGHFLAAACRRNLSDTPQLAADEFSFLAAPKFLIIFPIIFHRRSKQQNADGVLTVACYTVVIPVFKCLRLGTEWGLSPRASGLVRSSLGCDSQWGMNTFYKGTGCCGNSTCGESQARWVPILREGSASKRFSPVAPRRCS